MLQHLLRGGLALADTRVAIEKPLGPSLHRFQGGRGV
jgi:glucose-6-phosphate 1-dehydrogenase